jgi:hypothetical protein
VARIRVTDQAALAEALTAHRISGAGIRGDREPPVAHSPLCGIELVATIPHAAGEARRYDDNMRYCGTIWVAFGTAQSDDATRWSEAYRVSAKLSPCPNAPIAHGDAASAGIGAS